MVKAGALYFAIVIAFILAIVSASLIMLAAHYRNSYLKEVRYMKLLNNLDAGTAYMLTDKETWKDNKVIDLYGDGTDSLMIAKKQWGIFELATLKAFIAKDTLKRAFMIGEETDSTVLYLSDEDRPLSVSGTTKITGNASLPRSGLRKSYAEGKPYQNKELIYSGKMNFSNRQLDPLNVEMLAEINSNLEMETGPFYSLSAQQLSVSFLQPVQQFKLSPAATLADVTLKGNIILFADSSLHIKASAQLEGIQIYAPYIKVDDGFKGNCQLFAIDSIVIGNGAALNYPSVLGVVRTGKSASQPKIILGNDIQFNGIVFSYENKRSPMQTFISLGRNVKVNGEIYSTGLLKVEKEAVINGKASCNRFIMQTPTTLYENFLIDVSFNLLARNKYYLSSPIFDYKKERKVLKWLN